VFNIVKLSGIVEEWAEISLQTSCSLASFRNRQVRRDFGPVLPYFAVFTQPGAGNSDTRLAAAGDRLAKKLCW
jgi:hypothetical protein